LNSPAASPRRRQRHARRSPSRCRNWCCLCVLGGVELDHQRLPGRFACGVRLPKWLPAHEGSPRAGQDNGLFFLGWESELSQRFTTPVGPCPPPRESQHSSQQTRPEAPHAVARRCASPARRPSRPARARRRRMLRHKRRRQWATWQSGGSRVRVPSPPPVVGDTTLLQVTGHMSCPIARRS
jgi:hypothetical protein